MVVIILSMHRSGSSLVTSIIQKLGVHIGDNLLGTHPSQPRGHYENVEFYELNMAILKAAGGNWQRPPAEKRILAQKQRFDARIRETIARNRRARWGFKDPRTCLTLPLYLPHLKEPRFILVYRETSSIVGSLLRRSGGTKEKWERLTRIYQESMEKYVMGHDILRVQFKHLVSRGLADGEVWLINKFINGNDKLNEAISLIDFRT